MLKDYQACYSFDDIVLCLKYSKNLSKISLRLCVFMPSQKRARASKENSE